MILIKICFTDFWSQFNYYDNFFIRKLRLKFNIIIDEINPDVIIYSTYGTQFLKYTRAIRVIYIAENVRPSFSECDYSLSFDYPGYNNRNLRYPLYVMYGLPASMLLPKDSEIILKDKNHFCNMVVSNGAAPERIDFFNILNKLQRVDSGGKILNNIGGPVLDKLSFIKDYRFSIAFENSSFCGYTTEKILEPMKVNSIPIYWGSPSIAEEFNDKSFINVHDFSNLKAAAEHVIKIENNQELLKNMLSEPWFKNNKVTKYFENEEFNLFFETIFERKKSNSKYYYTKKQGKAIYSVIRKKIISKILKKSYCHIS